ncbi:hypothetical protein Q5752_001490 [Cryptotrichosporon argae]
MFKRNSKPPTVTPLPPPTPNGHGSVRNGSSGPNGTPPLGPGSSHGSGTPLAPRAPPGPVRPVPMPRSSTQSLTPPAMPVVERTISAMSGVSGSSKAEKRRSGFLGFGRKDKDKDKAGKDESTPAQRPSINPPSSSRASISTAPGARPASGQFQPYPTRQYPPSGSPYSPPSSEHRNTIGSTSSLNSSAPSVPSARSQPSSAPGNRNSPGLPPDIHPPNSAKPGTFPGYRNMGPGHDSPPANASAIGSVGSAGSRGSAPRSLPRSTSAPLNDVGPHPGSPGLRGGPFVGDAGVGADGRADWMRDFDPIVELITAQPHKTYLSSPPELEMIQARTSAGQQPKHGPPGSPSNDWDAVWLQLSGISLSTWSMKETRAAAAKGLKVPPTYYNITDSSLELLAALPPPPHRPDSRPHHYVFSLNTAGSNRLLFSCPSERDLAAWTSSLRVAAYERARLEEIYTGHLIRSAGREPRSPLVRGRLEGWVRVRVMGGTDWKRLWAVVSTPETDKERNKEDDKKQRRRSFFGIGDKDAKAPETVQEPNTGVPMAAFYTEPRTAKNKTIAPVLTITGLTQAYAVFPERLEVVSNSNLFKVVGRIGGDLVTIEGRLRDSGWALIMPDTPDATLPPANGSSLGMTPLVNMMRWVTGFHDAFSLYGRPGLYIWDEKDPTSLFFAYPRGERRTQLFLTTDEALMSDFRTPSLPSIRAQYTRIVQQRLDGMAPVTEHDNEEDEVDVSDVTESARPDSFRLPPLLFDPTPSHESHHHSSSGLAPRSLTPITERTDIVSRTNSVRTASSRVLNEFGTTTASAPTSLSGKQGSRDSDKAKPGASHLEAISDSAEALGVYPDDEDVGATGEKTPVLSPNSTMSENATNLSGPTVWSQDTGLTPNFDRAVDEREGQTTPTPTSSAPRAPASTYSPNGSANRPAPLTDSARINQPGTHGSPEKPAQLLSPIPRKASAEIAPGVHDEPAAMLLMNIVDEPAQVQPAAPTDRAQAVRSPSSSQQSEAPATAHFTIPPQLGSPGQRVRPTINTALDKPPAVASDPPRADARGAEHGNVGVGLGRKPSGARALPPKKAAGAAPRLEVIQDDSAGRRMASNVSTVPDFGEDAAAFMAYADQISPVKPTAFPTAQPQPPAQPVFSSPQQPSDQAQPISSLPPARASVDPPPAMAPPVQPQPQGRSSFAPSQAAMDRRAKVEAQETERARNMSLPGGGRRAAAADTWSGSSDEEDDDDEIDEAAENILVQRPTPGPAQRSNSRALPPVPRPVERTSTGASLGDVPPEPSISSHAHDRHASDHSQDPRASAYGSDPRASGYSQDPRGSRYSPQPQAYTNGQRHSSYAQPAPPPQAALVSNPRASVWNANFSVEHGHAAPASGKFVDLDEPGAQLTKAFAPHGLLQAGLQDREDRSAKKQEELARETGSSLVSVPSKPPPPQTGLLGAVAAHERDRKHAGGIGATLTDRDRERRLAEDRQRKIEELQRQQMEHMAQFGASGGFPQYPQFPYPQMPQMPQIPGYSPYMSPPGYNPAQQQAMYAAQLAYTQAYQHAMYSMSAAGSQAGTPGDERRPPSPVGSLRGPSPLPGLPSMVNLSAFNGAPPHPPASPYFSPYPPQSPYMLPPAMGVYGTGLYAPSPHSPYPPPPPPPHQPHSPYAHPASVPQSPYRGSHYDLPAQATGGGSAGERRD